jgi:hypothetical protein
MKKKLIVTHFDGVTSIGTAVKPGDDVVLFGQDVNQFSLTLVAPLGPQHGADLGVQAVEALLTGQALKHL